jgi:hypothetical protein
VHRLSVGSEVSMIPSGYTDETIFTDYISLRLIRFYATVYFMRYVFDFIRRDLFHFMRRNVVRARVLRGVFYWVGPRSAFLTCGSLCPTGGVRWLEKFLVTYLLHAGSSTESSENKYILVKLLFCIGGAPRAALFFWLGPTREPLIWDFSPGGLVRRGVAHKVADRW